MISKFFLDRPRFAAVLSIIIVLAGILSIFNLPVKEYPSLTPPRIIVTASYPGADAETVSKTVAAPLENAINGAKNMIYMSSTASNGLLSLSVYFEVGTNPDDAKVEVTNRVQTALSTLPEEVRRQGVDIRERSPDLIRVYTFLSEGNKRDILDLSNYVSINIADEIKRIKGVGDVIVFGDRKYSIRVWLKPDKLEQLNLTPVDVYNAIASQNKEFSAGTLDDQPAKNKYVFTYPVKGESRFSSIKQFENIIIRANLDGSTLKLKDVADVSLDSENYYLRAYYKGQPTQPMGIFLAPGANAVEVANAVEKRLEELSKNFPPDIKYEIAYNPVEFVEAAIKEVIRTLIEAIILVIIVTLFFLGRTRATAIPVLAIPISIIGAFAGLYLLGFSINLLTLFALILAVGLVVDDAIIVVENIERIIREEKLSPKEAAIKSMEEITPALIAIVIVLASVFIPPAFTGGFTGEMFKQFAATIAITMILSGLVALTLTPVLSAIFLKEEKKKMFIIFRGFGKLIEGFRWFFLKSVKVILKIWPISFVVLAGVSFAIFYLDKKLPSSLVPVEDKGSLFFITYSMPGSSLDTTEKNVKFVENLLSKDPVFHDYLSIIGLDFGAFAFKTDAANTFAHPIHWDKRDPKTQSTMALAKKYFKLVSQYRDALIFPVNPPPIMGLSTTGGFEVYIQDRTGGNIFKLSQIVNEFINEVNQRPELIGVRTTLNTIAPQYKIVVDRDKAESLGVNVDDVYTTIQMVFGKAYVNDFNLFGKVFHVNIGSLENYRNNIDDLRYIYVRSKNGDLIPVSSLIKESDRTATSLLFERFNMFPAAKIMGQASPGYSSGQALQALEEVAKKVLPSGYTLAYSGTSYQEKLVAQKGNIVYILSVVFIFLILVALYESWTLPISVLLVVPFAALGSYLGLFVFGLDKNIYLQIGIITLIGLSAKNAILMIEFAEYRIKNLKMSVEDAILEAARIRFRPIMMTSFAFIMGTLALIFSFGAGSGAMHTIGHTVVWGMLFSTMIGTFFIPAFYYAIKKLQMVFKKGQE